VGGGFSVTIYSVDRAILLVYFATAILVGLWVVEARRPALVEIRRRRSRPADRVKRID
jgi:hypothetical protein